ncbi:MAG: inosine triphosphate pyrophosphatase, partial [Candidatus Paceibacteria bacterium]
SSVIPGLTQLSVDLPEIQETDAKKVIEAKIKEAFKHKKGSFIVEDTSLYFDALNGLPGPLIKWFMDKIGNDGLFNLADKLGNTKAEAKTMIGYAENIEDIIYFEGSISGSIVPPTGDTDFGWDPIFRPDGLQKNFAEISLEEKNSISMRKIAFSKLKDFLESRK